VLPNGETPTIRYNRTEPETIQQVENRVMPSREFDASEVALPIVGPRK